MTSSLDDTGVVCNGVFMGNFGENPNKFTKEKITKSQNEVTKETWHH